MGYIGIEVAENLLPTWNRCRTFTIDYVQVYICTFVDDLSYKTSKFSYQVAGEMRSRSSQVLSENGDRFLSRSRRRGGCVLSESG